MRTGKVGIDYAMRVNWHQWLPRVKGKSRNPNAKNPIATKEVIIVGFYPTKEEARKHLEPLHVNGVRVVLIIDRKDTQVPDFVSVYRGSSLATALSQYLKERRIHDAVIERLATLGDACSNGSTEEAGYLRDSLYDPTNTGAIRSVVTQLSETGTVVGTPIYRGTIRRAEDYRGLRRDGFLR